MKNRFSFRAAALIGSILLLAGVSRAQDIDREAALEPSRVSTVGTITGKVVDAGTALPLEYAAISLFRQADSLLVNGVITDEKGVFKLEAPSGNFFLKIEFLGYRTKVIRGLAVSAGKPVTDLGVIAIEPESTVLREVVVEAQASQVQMTLDKKVYNVGQDLASLGGTAQDVLDNVPSVQVDVEGNVSLRGSENVRILIDGKPSGLIGISGTSGLRQLPANLIERVEVITNPSARYEAEGMAGIINIVLKKGGRTGLNGSFDLTAGNPHNYVGAFNLNYRTPRLNLFTSIGPSFERSPGRGFQYQEIYRGDTTFITQQWDKGTRGGWSANLRGGADYFFNAKNILTGAFTYRSGKDTDEGALKYYDYLSALSNPTAISVRDEEETEREYNMEYALNYRRTFDRKGQEFSADLRYQDNTENERGNLSEQFYGPDWAPTGEPDLLQRTGNRESERLLIGQADYVRPFGKEGKWEAGGRSSFRSINNDFLVEELSDGSWASIAGMSNNFRYQENIYAAYLIYGDKKGKFSYQVGVRPEWSFVSTELIQTGELNDRNYLNLFPSAHVTYDLPAENALQISYSRRLRRPRFWDLNPFFTFSDNRNFMSGNPDLDPEFTHSLEAGHLKYWKSGSLSSSIYYRHTDGVIERIRELRDDGTTLTRPFNLATGDAFGIDINGTYSPFEWWRINGNANFFRAIVNGENVGQSLHSDTYSWFVRGGSRFTLWKDTDIQLRFNYRAPQETTQGRRKSMSSVDLGASTDVLKGNGTLTLSVRDLFNTRRMRSVTEGEDFFSEGWFRPHPRQINLTLNYRLNQQKSEERERERDEEEEVY